MSNPSAGRVLWLVLVAIATLAATAAIAARRARASAAAAVALPVLGQVPSFAMPDQRGRVVSDDALLGQVLVVDFFYSSCTTSCPQLTARMRTVERAVAVREEQLGRALPVHLVSITLDPNNDTPDVLRAYADRFEADADRWSFLSGRSADLDRVVVKGFKQTFQRVDSAAGIAAIMHGEWLVLVDTTGAIRGYYASSDPERLQALVSDALRLGQLAGPREYHASGVVRSFGPGRAFANIEHGDIPGYMAAMTMSFEPQRPSLFDGLEPGDHVSFSFVETEDARRVITAIDKRR